jgi:transposase
LSDQSDGGISVRDRHSPAGKKSDHGDALVLAHILRTDGAAHRPLPADTELAQSIAVLARARQDAVWDRTQAHNKLRSHLREYFPAFLTPFASKRDGITRPDARAVLAAAPTPEAAAKLPKSRIILLLRKAGRQRRIEAEAARLLLIFRQQQMRQLPLVEEAMGRQALALVGQLSAASQNDLGEAAAQAFRTHPDAVIVTSFPGISDITGVRVLGELGGVGS